MNEVLGSAHSVVFNAWMDESSSALLRKLAAVDDRINRSVRHIALRT